MNTIIYAVTTTVFLLLFPYISEAQSLTEPKIVTINPDRGLAYQESVITIEGLNFQTDAKVFAGDQQVATIAFFEPGKIIILLPAQRPGGIDITLRNPDGQEHTLKKGFHYVRSIYEPIEKEISSVDLKIAENKNKSLKSKIKTLYADHREMIHRVTLYGIIFILLSIIISTNKKKRLLKNIHSERHKK